MIEIPLLEAEDVELRIAQLQTTQYGTYCTLLAYKTARTDFAILDKVFGPLGWQRKHEVIDGNLYCTVSVWDEEKQQWLSRQDVGVPSNTESEKGAASDSFKRACFNFSIGIELYDAPIIRFKLDEKEVSVGSNGKPKTYTKFKVDAMRYDREKNCFTEFTVVDEKGNIRFSLLDTVHQENPNTSFTEPFRHEQHSPTGNSSSSSMSNICSECGGNIPNTKVMDYSLKRFKRPLCYSCQKKVS